MTSQSLTGEELVERVARVLCCPNACRNADAQYAICQAHTFREDARAAIAALPDISSLQGEVERLRKALAEIRKLRSEPIGDAGFAVGSASLLRRAQEIAGDTLRVTSALSQPNPEPSAS